MILYLDTETKSGIDLGKYGVHRYTQDKDFTILLISYAIDNNEPKVCTPDAIPSELREALNSDCIIVIHNSSFDIPVLKAAKIADISYNRVHDTLIQALAHGLPASLKDLSKLYELGDLGKKTGLHLIKKFGSNFLIEEAAEEWNEFKEYALYDIISMRKLYYMMPRINYPDGLEYQNWLINRGINDLGIRIDLELAKSASMEANIAYKKANDRFYKLTNINATQNIKIVELLQNKYNLNINSISSHNVKYLLDSDDLCDEVRNILELKRSISATTPKKYEVLLKSCVDERIFDTLQFMGASRTGRDAGRSFQPQNLKRPSLFKSYKTNEDEDKAIEKAVELVKQHRTSSLGDVFHVLSDLVRNVIIPSNGKKFVVADLSNIEGRVLPWLAGEQYKVNNFKDYDAGILQYDNYIMAYSKAMNIDPKHVNKDMRSIGKVMELALGYGGGVATFSQFAAIYGLNLEELAHNVKDTLKNFKDANIFNDLSYFNTDFNLTELEYKACNYLKVKWRMAHPCISAFWRELENGFRYCIEYPNKIYKVGSKILMKSSKEWLYVKLPSNRYLTYFKAGLSSENNIYYIGKLKTAGVGRMYTYGGRLTENVTSAVARDILYQNLHKIKKAGYEPVLLVHDEIVAEASIEDRYNGDHLASLMSKQLHWCKDLPLSAAGFETFRYKGK